MIAAKITQQQAEELQGVEYIKDNYFNPVQDLNDNWVISLQELTYCPIEFVSTVELVEFEPKQVEI